MNDTRNKLQKVELTEEQQDAVNAICSYNNFALFSEGANNEMTIILKARADILERGFRNIAQYPPILEIMTNVVIDMQNQRK